MTVPAENETNVVAVEPEQNTLEGAPATTLDSPSNVEDFQPPAEQPGNDSNQAGNDDDYDDDDITIIGLDHDAEEGGNDQQAAALAWIEQNGPEMEERRRNVLLRELQRVQRASFIHFVLLCLIPTSLLFIVIATVLGDDEECFSEATHCEKEARTFINAFTTRCICDAIDVAVEGDGN
uniref:Uncharacterized protein n=1 Tax=Grammatophora oceanica TaxID=210454 RepID=A0A7S1VIA6_9STRA|mmetsp:Transcript_4729/g.6575  ORF Transcript_4729/g.6575 Transcript_4729/m.6575 type:complete len:179 (+) Transcript_4729:121-657(+)|eukprot:CAMPEP_0194048338 /NCGR_PEP_ID=MMETSP0009_2-20130614/26969_1 /TAXON_ID=210454 /ORGANISM="Grammatophora oceanica, Strain CCMP 410" /LENGTH=178 /DNA_ID=CAMNT_0038694177 /DNA_START=118 /DNA_END=654 /DNA_ORIENTATION=+